MKRLVWASCTPPIIGRIKMRIVLVGRGRSGEEASRRGRHTDTSGARLQTLRIAWGFAVAVAVGMFVVLSGCGKRRVIGSIISPDSPYLKLAAQLD
jgi:hypothetical protein